MHGELIERGAGWWSIWVKPDPENGVDGGFIARHGGFTQKIDHAMQVEGSGRAIRMAQVFHVAITNEVLP